MIPTAVTIAVAEVAGFFVLLPASMLNAWTEPTTVSSKPLRWASPPYTKRTYVDQWRWQWLNSWYGNIEDGVSGQQAWVWGSGVNEGKLVPYASLYPSWTPKWVIAYGWSAWRNGANNVKRPLRPVGK
jgi:hypothetical protein